MEFFGINASDIFGKNIFDLEDLLRLLFRFLINFVFAFIIIKLVYYSKNKRKEYLFTYFIFNIITFFICFLLRKVPMELGFALGLFAVFGVLRYRTEQIPIKEMTYLFIVIGLAMINSLSNKSISFVELIFANAAITFVTFGLERLWLLKHESRKVITYEKIDMITPENHHKLQADLENRTGLTIQRFEIGKINFLNDTVTISIYYYEDEQKSIFKEAQKPNTIQTVIPKSIGCMILGISSIPGAFVFGIGGIICGILALFFYKKGKNAYDTNPEIYKQSALSFLKTGKITGIIGLILSVCYLTLTAWNILVYST